ncbi:hypothetical protein [Microcoleus sp. FACHB-672]|uniref:hypothetical protein n=1 Tax=Microcoleus sp. FACHB-672 TaxID=2692825 RepID=UPI00168661CD|nr:hypothetical protein [Microcoleus sp. FACHB-672]MBD2043420.1 hypothetical protein [Microcoleus sp. FACHB-672]
MKKFTDDWSRELGITPPREQTIRNFLEKERNVCEFWLLDGFCQLLLGCSVDELPQIQQASIPPQKDTKIEISEDIGDEHTLSISAVNPFLYEKPVTNPNDFIGRKLLLNQLFEELARGGNRSLVGEGKIGKSSILWMICKLGPERLRRPSEAFIYLDMRNVYDKRDFFEGLCKKLQIKPPCRGGKLKQKLKNRNQNYILCLDEIDNMAHEEYFTEKERAELCGLAEEECNPLTLVTASERPLRYLFPDSPNRSSPLAGLCRQIEVGRFSPEEARELLTQRLTDTGITFSESQISELVAESNGYPDILQQKAADLYRRLTQQ